MSQQRPMSLLPAIGLVSGLFVLSVLAPRSWQSLAVPELDAQAFKATIASADPTIVPDVPEVLRSKPADGVAASVADEAQRRPAVAEQVVFARDAASATQIGPGNEVADAEPADAEPADGVPADGESGGREPGGHELVDGEPAEHSHSPHVPLAALGQLDAPRRDAEVAPPVAERIELDPSVADGPPLPPLLPAKVAESPEPQSLDSALPEEESENEPAAALPKQQALSTVVRAWPATPALDEELKSLHEQPAYVGWAERVQQTLADLRRGGSLGAVGSQASLDRLRGLADEARRLAADAKTPEQRSMLLRAGFSLSRRLALWQPVAQITSWVSTTSRAEREAGDDVLRRIDAFERELRHVQRSGEWRQYFLLDDLRQMVKGGEGVDSLLRRELSREILVRLESPELSEKQYEYFQQGPFRQLAESLGRWASEPVDYPGLLEEIERYEQRFRSDSARRIAEAYQAVRWADDERVGKLAEHLNSYYRNANVRVAISGELINRLLPSPEAIEESVDDQLLGAQVRGHSRTRTRLRVQLLPDRLRWRLGLEAYGEVASKTSATKGPVTFFNEGHSQYRAEKEVRIGRRGILVGLAEAKADAASDLTGLETEFDGVPLLGSLARAIAVQQHDSQRADARWQVEEKVAGRVRSRFDEEVHQRIEEFEQNFQTKLLDPLRRLDLHPTPVDMQTTRERLIARYRLAGHYQLGAHTPRPQAPGDSMLSVQIHESAFNNIVEQLKLDGRRVELRELYRELVGRFESRQVEVPDDIPEGVMVHFADRDSVRVHCSDGRIALTIRLAELSAEDHQWRNLMIRGYYRPDAQQLDANLVRDGVVELRGHRLNLRDQVALRGIFSKIMSRNRSINLINRKLAEDRRLADLQVTQFVLNHGWIGVALGPKREAANHLVEQP